MKLYKLTDKDDRTYGSCQWGEGITHKADGKGELCTEHWIHAYTDPLLAVLMNPIHGKYDTDMGHMWECKGEIGKDDNGLKGGCKKLTTTKRIDMPEITTEQRIWFAILCAKKVYKNKKWNKWANDWLSGKNRTADAARAADAADAAYVAHAADAATYAKINLVEIAHKAIRGTR